MRYLLIVVLIVTLLSGCVVVHEPVPPPSPTITITITQSPEPLPTPVPSPAPVTQPMPSPTEVPVVISNYTLYYIKLILIESDKNNLSFKINHFNSKDEIIHYPDGSAGMIPMGHREITIQDLDNNLLYSKIPGGLDPMTSLATEIITIPYGELKPFENNVLRIFVSDIIAQELIYSAFLKVRLSQKE